MGILVLVSQPLLYKSRPGFLTPRALTSAIRRHRPAFLIRPNYDRVETLLREVICPRRSIEGPTFHVIPEEPSKPSPQPSPSGRGKYARTGSARVSLLLTLHILQQLLQSFCPQLEIEVLRIVVRFRDACVHVGVKCRHQPLAAPDAGG